jgi:acyl carrier protein
MENFDVEIAEILEVDSVNMNDNLNEFECWDSLTILSIIAFASESYQIILSASEINGAVSVGGLKVLIETKIK